MSIFLTLDFLRFMVWEQSCGCILKDLQYSEIKILLLLLAEFMEEDIL